MFAKLAQVNTQLESLEASGTTSRNEIIASYTGNNIGDKILVIQEHQVPSKPSVAMEVKVPASIATTLEQEEEHITKPTQQGEIS